MRKESRGSDKNSEVDVSYTYLTQTKDILENRHLECLCSERRPLALYTSRTVRVVAHGAKEPLKGAKLTVEGTVEN